LASRCRKCTRRDLEAFRQQALEWRPGLTILRILVGTKELTAMSGTARYLNEKRCAIQRDNAALPNDRWWYQAVPITASHVPGTVYKTVAVRFSRRSILLEGVEELSLISPHFLPVVSDYDRHVGGGFRVVGSGERWQ
jgi:hypothetical protein